MSIMFNVNSIKSTSCETCNSIFTGIAELKDLQGNIQKRQTTIEGFKKKMVSNEPNLGKKTLNNAIEALTLRNESEMSEVIKKTNAIQRQIALHSHELG